MLFRSQATANLTINGSGVISVSTATTSQLGAVKVDGTSITISGGTISSTCTTGKAIAMAMVFR